MKTLALTAACFFAVSGAAEPLHAAPARPGRISVSYVAPKNPAHQPIYQRLKKARFLKRLQEFLSPVRLPRTLRVRTEGCDGEANAWYDGDAITICYETGVRHQPPRVRPCHLRHSEGAGVRTRGRRRGSSGGLLDAPAWQGRGAPTDRWHGVRLYDRGESREGTAGVGKVRQ
jgi:hypothetical protein